MTATSTPAEIFPPGEFLRYELDERSRAIAEFEADVIAVAPQNGRHSSLGVTGKHRSHGHPNRLVP